MPEFHETQEHSRGHEPDKLSKIHDIDARIHVTTHENSTRILSRILTISATKMGQITRIHVTTHENSTRIYATNSLKFHDNSRGIPREFMEEFHHKMRQSGPQFT